MMPAKSTEQRRATYKLWYERNKGKFNSARKERYKNDPAYRAAQQSNGREQKRKQRDGKHRDEGSDT